MIGVVDPALAEADLAAGRLACPSCNGVLRQWGHAGTRRIRDLGAATLSITPRRARCADCGATQVLLPGPVPAAAGGQHRGDRHRVDGQRCRDWRIAAQLHRPVSTVRRWVRSVSPAHAERLRVAATDWLVRLDPEAIARLAPARIGLGDALAALAAAATAARARVATTAPAWALFARFAGWQLLGRARAG